MPYFNCPVCAGPSTQESKEKWLNVNCFRCGIFNVDATSLAALNNLEIKGDASKIALTSGWIQEHPNELLREEALAFNLKIRPPTVGEQAEKLIRKIASSLPLGEQFGFSKGYTQSYLEAVQESDGKTPIGLESEQVAMLWLPLQLMGASCCRTVNELEYLLTDYLTDEKHFLLSNDGKRGFKVSPAGWAHIEDGGRLADSQFAFVAMWFSADTTKLWEEGIYPGVLSSGYKPFRIDKYDHNNRIDDEIIASIRRSKFLVADFTKQRGGVYFEAGFALGLGQQVVWLCKKSELDDIHFDTRQYNFITWEEGKWSELARALTLRIEATIGKGTYVE